MKINKKAAGPLGNVLFAIVAIAVFSGVMMNMIGGVNQTYDLDINQTEFETFNQIEQISTDLQANISNKLEEDVANASGPIGDNSLTSVFQLGIQNKGLKIILEAPAILRAVITDTFTVFSTYLKIPDIILGGALAMISIFIMWALISLVFRRDA